MKSESPANCPVVRQWRDKLLRFETMFMRREGKLFILEINISANAKALPLFFPGHFGGACTIYVILCYLLANSDKRRIYLSYKQITLERHGIDGRLLLKIP